MNIFYIIGVVVVIIVVAGFLGLRVWTNTSIRPRSDLVMLLSGATSWSAPTARLTHARTPEGASQGGPIRMWRVPFRRDRTCHTRTCADQHLEHEARYWRASSCPHIAGISAARWFEAEEEQVEIEALAPPVPGGSAIGLSATGAWSRADCRW